MLRRVKSDFSQLSVWIYYTYTYTYTHIYIHNNAVLEELLRKLACCRHDFSPEEFEEHLSSYKVSPSARPGFRGAMISEFIRCSN